jgi:hypothetical protein
MEQQEEQVDQLGKSLSKLPFDFEKGPLADVRIVHLSPFNHVLLFTLHHVISDEITLDVLRKELIALYDAYTSDMADPLPPVRLQYKEYAKWVKDFLAGEKGLASREFLLGKISESIAQAGVGHAAPSYKQQLNDELKRYLKKEDVGEIADRALGYIVNIYMHPSASYTFYLSNRYLIRLKRLASRHRVTLFSVVLALLSLLLRKARQEKYQRIYVPFDTRVFERCFDIIGWLVGAAIVCLDCDAERTLNEWIPIVEDAVLEAADYRLFPYEQIMKELDITVDVLFTMHVNFVRGYGVIKDFTPSHNYDTQAHFDLTWTVNEYENGLRFLVNYRTDKYAHAEITAISELIQQWLEQA